MVSRIPVSTRSDMPTPLTIARASALKKYDSSTWVRGSLRSRMIESAPNSPSPSARPVDEVAEVSTFTTTNSAMLKQTYAMSRLRR
jgi:hypothetical protein